MNQSPRQKRLVSLVRKLLELARSNSNAHEAGVALARAQKLMVKYGISERDATLSTVQQAPSQGAPSEARRALPEWMSRLAWTVGSAFGCRLYFSWREMLARADDSDNSLPDDVRAGMRTAAAFANMFIDLSEVSHG
ncbi:TPA: DUF2786 domain-containing protein [Serratia marcescens]|nr:DUF2786 domain-containing protein [Serratia marcescens]